MWDSAQITWILSRFHYDFQESIMNTAWALEISWESVINRAYAEFTNKSGANKIQLVTILDIHGKFPQDKT